MMKLINNLFKCFCSLILIIYTNSVCTSTFETNIPDIGQSGNWIIDAHQERMMGTVMMQKLHASGFVTTDAVVNDYLHGLSEKLQKAAPHLEHKLHFFCLDSGELNAFAFFGGHIAVHGGLIVSADSESELAAVLAHETAHIQQHHLARILTNNKKMMPLTAAEVLGAIALGVLGGVPEAGAHLATAALGSHVQNIINYTRMHEQEADRIGIQILSKAGFDPNSMAAMFHKLQAKMKYQTKPPEYLLTHPFFEDRIADAMNRAIKMPRQVPKENVTFHLVRARIVAFDQEFSKKRVHKLKMELKNNPTTNATALEYALALSLMRNRQFEQAEELMNTLIDRYPNEWMLKYSLAELEQEKGNLKQAQQYYQTLYEENPKNFALCLAYANILLELKQAKEAKALLLKQQRNYSKEPELLQLLVKAHSLTGAKTELHQTQAEWHFLRGEFPQMFQQLDLALEHTNKNTYRATQIINRKKEVQEIIKEQKSLS